MQSLLDSLYRTICKCIAFYRRDGSRHIAFLLDAVADDHDIFEKLSIFGKCEIQYGCPPHCLSLVHISETRDDNSGIRADTVEDILSVRVSDNTGRCALNQNRRSDYRDTLPVKHCSREPVLLGRCLGTGPGRD